MGDTVNKNEMLLVEEFRRIMVAKPEKQDYDNDLDDVSYKHRHNEIDKRFRTKAIEGNHGTSMCSAFAKVHSHMFITDPDFTKALDKEMLSRGVPSAERIKAKRYVGEIANELDDDQNCGFSKNLDDITTLYHDETKSDLENIAPETHQEPD